MPYHPLLESIFEQAKGSGKTGTTGRGMGPVYADKVSYNGIRLTDLADPERFRRRLEIQLNIKNPILAAFDMQTLDLEELFDEKSEQYRQLEPFVREPFGYLQEALAQDKNIVLEGAQGALLDTDWGTYPFTTASTTLAGGAAGGLGIAPRWINRVVGVAKAYTTRVGGGPMPTELHDEVGETLAREGQEFGTVTGRPRRCGWFDADLVRFTAALNGATEITLTKLDVLDTLPAIKIGVGYRRPQQESEEAGNQVYHYWQGDAAWLEDCQPEYIEVDGWQHSTRDAREFEQLPPAARAYVRKVEELVGVPVRTVSVGPEREAVIRVPSLN